MTDRDAARSAEFRAFLNQQGYEPLPLGCEVFSARIRTGPAKWASVVRERNIKVE